MNEKAEERYRELRVNLLAMSELSPPREVQAYYALQPMIAKAVANGGSLPLIPYSTGKLRELVTAHESMSDLRESLDSEIEVYFTGISKEAPKAHKELKALRERFKALEVSIDYELEVLRYGFELQELIFNSYLEALRRGNTPKEHIALEEARLQNYLHHFKLKSSTDSSFQRVTVLFKLYDHFKKEFRKR